MPERDRERIPLLRSRIAERLSWIGHSFLLIGLSGLAGAISCLTLFYPTDLRGVAAGAAAGATVSMVYVLIGWVIAEGARDVQLAAAALGGAAGGAVWKTVAGVRFPIWGAMIIGAILVTIVHALQSPRR